MTWRVAILAFTIMLAGATRAADPGRRRRPRRLPRDGRGDGRAHRWSASSARTSAPAARRSARSQPGAGTPARPAADRRQRARLPAAADHLRHPGAGHRLHARRRRLPGRATCSARTARRRSCSSASSAPRCCSRRPGRRSAPGSARSAATSSSSVVLASGAAARGLAPDAPAGGRLRSRSALVGVGYAGAQVFPMAMLPDAAAVDARRTGENRAGVYTGVWTAGETLGLALGPGRLRAWCSPSAATCRRPTATSPSPTRR